MNQIKKGLENRLTEKQSRIINILIGVESYFEKPNLEDGLSYFDKNIEEG